jgi:PAS domain S-box-containing protein
MKLRFYTLLIGLGCIIVFVVVIAVNLQFYNITMRYNTLTQTSYHNYIEHLTQNTLADMARYIEKQGPALRDTERLKQEARTEWFWATSQRLTEIAENFNFAYIYYIEKNDEGYTFLMSSGIGKAEHPEWLHGPVWEGDTPAFIDEAWETGQLTFSQEPTVNEWGTLISAELPILNNGVVVGVLGIDYDISFLDELRKEEIRLNGQESNHMRTILRIIIISAVFVILILCFQMYIGYKWVLVPVQRMETEERTQIMLDATPLACFLIDSNGRVHDSNQEAVTLFDAESKQYLEEHFFNFMPANQPSGLPSRGEAMNRIHTAMENGRVRFEWTHCAASGRLIPAEVTLVRVNWRDGYRVTGFVRDLTAIKEAEKKIADTERYRRDNRNRETSGRS